MKYNNNAFTKNLTGDLFGGTAAMLVALPSAIAFGLIIFAPLGPEFSGKAAIGGIMGTIALALIAPLIGGTKKLVTAPCAPAAAVLSAFVAEIINEGSIPTEIIPVYITIVSLLAGALQVVIGNIGGGKIIKYIPYPVVAGYLSGVGVLIFMGQLPKFLGFPKGVKLWEGLIDLSKWEWESMAVGTATIIMMVMAPKIIKVVPATIVALVSGIACYFGISFLNPLLLSIQDNHFIIGPISASATDLYQIFINHWSLVSAIDFSALSVLAAPVFTLAVLLSIDTLKTCVILDALTQSRHNSNRELIGQGSGNIASALLCGIPGAGTMGATLVNLNSGARTQFSGVLVGVTALLVLLLLGKLIAWIPVSALAGILLVVAYRMVDKKSFSLLKHRSTMFDFAVILGVIISAILFDLITAAGVGIGLAILLFLREQMRTSVIRRKTTGDQTFSKQSRITRERDMLEKKGKHTVILELQGQLFFGTTDQLLSEMQGKLPESKYVLLDMRKVQSVDFTAVNMFKQILARLGEHKGYLIFTSVPLSLPTGQHVKEYFGQLGMAETEHLKFFDSLNEGLEWVEDEILRIENIVDDSKVLELREIELLSGFSDDALKKLSIVIKEKAYQPGEYIFRMGSQGDEIFFVRKGNVEIILPLAGGISHYLTSIPKGSFVGDMSFLDRRNRSADAVADEEVILFILSRKKFDEIAAQYPEVAGMFFEKLAFVISNRLRQSNIELKALQES